jgi:choline dehydrogenase
VSRGPYALQILPKLIDRVVTNLMTPNVMSLSTDSAYNAQEWTDFGEHSSSAFTIVKNQSTTFGTMALDFVPQQQKIIADIQSYNAADSLPANVDPTVLAGYEAQRKVLVSQFQSSNISSGILTWDTGSTGQIIALKPLSRGTLHINSTDPLADPLIDFRTCTDPADFDILSAYFHKQRQLFASDNMAPLGPSEFAPGAKVQSDDEIVEFIKQTLIPSNAHECCSAPMMAKELGGACDAERKVYGVQGLRIGDVSAIPIAVAAGPTPSTYGSAEKVCCQA